MASKAITIRLIKKTDATVKGYPFPLDESGEDMQEYLVDTENGGPDYLLRSGAKGNSEAPLMLETKGVITESGDNLSVTYETHLSEMIPSVVTYSFNKSKRDILTVKKQHVNEVIEFYTVNGKSQYCSIDSKNLEDDATRFTKSLKNYITYENGGYIELEYFDELDGEMFEYTKEYLIVEPVK